MPDWSSPEALAKDAAMFSKLVHVSTGIYFWEFTVSLDFEWLFLSGQKKARWPLIFYFLSRYCLLFVLIGCLIALDVTTEINCQSLYTFNQLFGNASVGLPSINLALRTMAIWDMKPYIVAPLVLIILGHWSLILQGVVLKAAWVEGQGCVITHTNNKILAATFIYSMCFDLIILVLSGSKLYNRRQSSPIGALLFKDGLFYFVIALISNLVATTFMLLNLNAVMSVFFNVPAAVASTIVACRVVRRLNTFTMRKSQPFSANPGAISPARDRSEIMFARSGEVQSPGAVTSFGVYPKSPARMNSLTGIHVQMDTFTTMETRDEEKHGRKAGRDVENALDSKSRGL